jgi:hypothetical protein
MESIVIEHLIMEKIASFKWQVCGVSRTIFRAYFSLYFGYQRQIVDLLFIISILNIALP